MLGKIASLRMNRRHEMTRMSVNFPVWSLPNPDCPIRCSRSQEAAIATYGCRLNEAIPAEIKLNAPYQLLAGDVPLVDNPVTGYTCQPGSLYGSISRS